MKIIRDISNLKDCDKGAVVAIGNFDGFHCGHLAILAKAAQIAKETDRPLAMMSFEPHPRVFFGGKEAGGLRIYSLRDKLQMAKELGVQLMFMVRFNQHFSSLSAEEFISEVLFKKLAASHVITGEDFCFGKGRRGDKDLLTSEAKRLGFSYTPYPRVDSENGEKIASSTIREHLAKGEVREAASLLGRNYHIAGRVVHGKKLGRDLGFPTANITPRELFLPKFGVYAVCCILEDGELLNGVANLGIKPSVGVFTPCLEVHLFDINQDLYGKRMRVEFMEFIRPEQKFASLSELKTQIEQDIATAKRSFAI